MANSLKGKTVVFTGTLKMVRAVATTYAVKAGANVTKNVSGNTDIVVAGGDALGGWGSKVDAAKAKGVTVWNEARFMKEYNIAMNLPAGDDDCDEGDDASGSDAGSDDKPTLSAAGKKAQDPPSWQWYDDSKTDWISFASSDSDLIESRFASSDFKFGVTSELSFNKSHKTLYEFDLLGKKQKNTDSGRVRKIRRVRNGVEDYTRIIAKAAGKAVKRNRDDESDEDEDEDSDEFWNDDVEAHSEVKVTPSVIGKVQQALGGKKLPQAYVSLCQKTGRNGGAPKKCWIIPPGKDEDSRLQVETIYGIAMDGVVSEQENWMEEWEYPDIGIYFADTESGGHDMWALDYRKCGPKGEPSVVHVDQESDPEFKITKVADSFQEFLDKLISDPDDE